MKISLPFYVQKHVLRKEKSRKQKISYDFQKFSKDIKNENLDV
jgi:hypothetical protein